MVKFYVYDYVSDNGKLSLIKHSGLWTYGSNELRFYCAIASTSTYICNNGDVITKYAIWHGTRCKNMAAGCKWGVRVDIMTCHMQRSSSRLPGKHSLIAAMCSHVLLQNVFWLLLWNVSWWENTLLFRGWSKHLFASAAKCLLSPVFLKVCWLLLQNVCWLLL